MSISQTVKTFTSFLGWVVIGCLILYTAFNGFTSGLCGNEIISEAESQNKQYIATIFERNCGVTSSYYRIVNVRDSDAVFDGDNYELWVFSLINKPNLKAEWSDSNSLSITYPPTPEMLQYRPTSSDIKISLKQAE